MMKHTDEITTIGSPQGSLTTEAGLIGLLLADKRSPQTRRAYAADLRDFFGSGQSEPSPAAVAAFVSLSIPHIAGQLALYKNRMLTAGLSEATVNRRLAAVKSLLKMAHRTGFAQTDGRGLVDSEKSKAYRDTRGIDGESMRRLIALPKLAHGDKSLLALRDTALLRLLCENALRRAEVCSLNVSDFDAEGRRLFILGKGKGSQKAPVTLSEKSTLALLVYLSALTAVNTANGQSEDAPLFRSLDRRPGIGGQRLQARGLHLIVQEYGKRLGVNLAPHKLRHSSITEALERTGGDVRGVQKLSRHAKIDTLLLYDDARRDRQGEITDLLSAGL